MRRFLTHLAFLSVALVLSIAPRVRAEFISGTHGLNNLGKFTGTFEYSTSDVYNATLTLTLANTTASHLGGYITAFAFNNPGDAITGAKLTSSNPNFSLLGSPGFHNGVNGAPYGHFDLGAGTGGSFEGGGKPNFGIAPGTSESFVISLHGTGLNQLNIKSFLMELSVGPGDGHGHEPFEVRFRGFSCEPGSDKVPIDRPYIHNPEPSAVLLAGIGAVCLAGLQIYRVRRRA